MASIKRQIGDAQEYLASADFEERIVRKKKADATKDLLASKVKSEEVSQECQKVSFYV